MTGKPLSEVGCPRCGVGPLRTVDSRPSALEGVVRKRIKRCGSCQYRCTTHEVIVADTDGFANSNHRLVYELRKEIDALFAKKFPDIARHVVSMGGRK